MSTGLPSSVGRASAEIAERAGVHRFDSCGSLFAILLIFNPSARSIIVYSSIIREK